MATSVPGVVLAVSLAAIGGRFVGDPGKKDCASEKLRLVPAASCRLTFSVTEKRVAVAGTFIVRRKFVEAPMFRRPRTRGSAGEAIVTVPLPESVRSTT